MFASCTRLADLPRPAILATSACLIAGLLLSGCKQADNSALDVAVIDNPQSPPDAPTAAPGAKTEGASIAQRLVRAATTEGLVSFDAQGRVVPALADRWIITDDGQSYIFRLRDGNWRNGDELTANSARSALLAALKAIRGTALDTDLAGIDEIRVMAGRVIEIRLLRPMPYFLQLLAQPELGLVHDKEGAGPMAIEDGAGAQAADGASAQGAALAAAPAGGPKEVGAKRADARGDGLAQASGAPEIERLVPIEPSRLGLPAVESWARRTRGVTLHELGGAEAVKAFNQGKVDLVLGGRIEDFLLTRDVGILRGTIQLDPVSGLFGLRVMRDTGFLADPANREVLSMAIDRKALIDSFGLGGWTPTTRIVAPGLDEDLGTIGERWGGQSLEERRALAAARVRGWMAAHAQPADGAG
ncbi:ABC transporter substrate-binding protein, partial [Novosphingobium sp. 1949]